MYKIVFLKNERNDATDYYIQLIKGVIEQNGHETQIVDNLNLINKEDKVLTISLKAFFYLWLRNPRQFIFHWFQGVTPEEAMLIFKKPIERKLRWAYLSFFEKFVLKFSKFNFFVSDSMKNHYQKKYGYNKNNYVIMPCYNQAINIGGFSYSKYLKPTFVYAGSMSEWQCVIQTLLIFKSVQVSLKEAKMYLFTSEKDKAYQLINDLDIKNIEVDYIPYQDLNKKLQKIKYGFLIRDNNVVNNVATPTKMNGYLANGVIPIYSDYIEDFKMNLKSNYIVNGVSVNDFAEKIINFENLQIDRNDILKEYSVFFNTYYNDSYYKNSMMKKFKEFDVI